MGPYRCENPIRVCGPAFAIKSVWQVCGGESRSILWGAVGCAKNVYPIKRGRGDRAKSRSRLLFVYPRRMKPKGASSDCRAKPTGYRQGLMGGRDPGTAARRAGPSPRWREYRLGKTVGGSFRPGNLPEASCEGKASKGESQERCRCETQPAGDQREQAVKRVAKP
jgi:hypothetical protein